MNHIFRVKEIIPTIEQIVDIGFDKSYIHRAMDKHLFKTYKIENLTCAQANIIKQIALSVGTDCAVHREVITGKIDFSDCILSGSISHINKIIDKLQKQPLGLKNLAEILDYQLKNYLLPIKIRDRGFDWSKTYVMGILNVTPDSFSDGGLYVDIDKSIEQFQRLIYEGADIIDIGGESTRPNAENVSPEEECKRVLPVIKHIRELNSEVVISIDTRNAITAEKALCCGADIVNDISGLDWDSKMIDVIKVYNCPVILNHSSAPPDSMQQHTDYDDVLNDISIYFQNKINTLVNNGVERSKIIIDPGIGFGKTLEQNYEIINRISELKCLNQPILVGHSRKSFIKNAIQSDNVSDLDNATMIISDRLIREKVNIIRIHNIEQHNLLFCLNHYLC